MPERRFPPPWSVGVSNREFSPVDSEIQSSPVFAFFRRCMKFANAIPPKMNRHKTTNMMKLFVGVGTVSGKCIGTSSAPANFGALT
jgi:hypothetical protein